MNNVVKLTKQNDVAIITFDNPPANALSLKVREGLVEAVAAANADAGIRALVITGGGKAFSAGADINEFATALASGKNDSPEMHDFFHQLEDNPKPVVMAIQGHALGGGLELAMAGHYRAALPDAVVGQPELNLGIIPGAEGTQRLPRLVGLAAAVDLCLGGAPVKAAEAVKLGILDRVIEGDLLAGAAQFAREVAGKTSHPKTSGRTDKLAAGASEHAAILKAGRDKARKTRRNLNAAVAVIDALEAATTLPFDEGCKREREIFQKCFTSDQAKSLIHAFLAERGVSKIPGLPSVPPPEIRQAAIIGSGTMGSGIAMVFANVGIPVLLTDSNKEALNRGVATIRKNYENSVKKGRFTQQVAEERIGLIKAQPNMDGFENADVIIEAVFESMDLKKQIFTQIDKIAKPSCLLASNTSSLDIDEIAKITSRPQSVVGLHFFSPANVMRLVEVVRGKLIGKETIAAAMALTKRLKKVGVLVGNNPGFVGNRMMFPYMREAQFLLEEGATPSQVDGALFDWGMAMGILAVDDMAGIDTAYKVNAANKHLRKPGVRVPLVLDKLYEMGRLGQKTGKGWFVYDENRRAMPDPEVEALIEKTAKDAGIQRRKIDNQEIIERCVYVMINEGARILEEGHALRAADIDTVYLSGYGFPNYRGGPMWYADTVGLEKILRCIEEFHKQHGELWAPAPLLQKLVQQGKTFAALDQQVGSAAEASRTGS
jgi:3-hydroxyacyl-CoA dehydrogenase